jgi:hypothetical protein
MGYYIRVLGTNLDIGSLQSLRDNSRPAFLNVMQGTEDMWERIVLTHESGQEIAVVEKNPVIAGQLGADELQEFIEEVAHFEPESAVSWLRDFLPTVKVIYAFQLLNGTDVNDGWTSLHSLYSAVWKYAGGILQADGEGFTDEQGFTIVWQFEETVSGVWNMGSLQAGHWVHFEMNLGNEQQRADFKRGEVPRGAKML